MRKNTPTLARKIGLWLLTFYGLGTILGAGIYVLVGKVAASAGLLAPLAFLISALVAGITALSYCQLVVHFPKSAGDNIGPAGVDAAVFSSGPGGGFSAARGAVDRVRGAPKAVPDAKNLVCKRARDVDSTLRFYH